MLLSEPTALLVRKRRGSGWAVRVHYLAKLLSATIKWKRQKKNPLNQRSCGCYSVLWHMDIMMKKALILNYMRSTVKGSNGILTAWIRIQGRRHYEKLIWKGSGFRYDANSIISQRTCKGNRFPTDILNFRRKWRENTSLGWQTVTRRSYRHDAGWEIS